MISTHVLDLNLGQPASNISVQLEKQMGRDWQTLANERTNSDGRVVFQGISESGIYRLNFDIGEYSKKTGLSPFFIHAPVIFEIKDTTRKYHVPLLLSQYGYSTYRGS